MKINLTSPSHDFCVVESPDSAAPYRAAEAAAQNLYEAVRRTVGGGGEFILPELRFGCLERWRLERSIQDRGYGFCVYVRVEADIKFQPGLEKPREDIRGVEFSWWDSAGGDDASRWENKVRVVLAIGSGRVVSAQFSSENLHDAARVAAAYEKGCKAPGTPLKVEGEPEDWKWVVQQHLRSLS